MDVCGFLKPFKGTEIPPTTHTERCLEANKASGFSCDPGIRIDPVVGIPDDKNQRKIRFST